MVIVCPQCHSSLETNPAQSSGSIVCTTCGASFQVEHGSTIAWQRGEQGRKLGRFELLDLVGSGAFGSVFKARDPKLDRTVAVKVPRQGDLGGPEDRDRLVREARSVAQLSHPGIVPVHEVGEQDGLPFLVSEFVEGVTLADQLTARWPSFPEAARLVATVAATLHYAHQQGVVHRDIKPSNIMLEAAGTPRLMDFGLAKRDAGEVTVTTEGQVLGTPAYMSPEQARGEAHAVDGRSDVYSLGVILYQLLTRELPFRGNARMLLNQVLHDDPRPPRRLNDRVPHDLQTICLKAMAREPQRRYPTAAEFAADLERWLNNQPIQARPPSPWYRWRKFAARNRALVVGTAATFLALLLGVVGTGAALWQARAETRRANAARAEVELEKENALEAERQRKAELIRTHGVAARLAGQRGEWDKALEHYDAALAGHPENEVALWLGKLDARGALYQYKELRAELATLAKRSDLGKHAGTVRLYQGKVRLLMTNSQDGDPLELVRDALRMELPPAERAFAQALLAPTAPEAISHLQKAVAIDPFHRRSYDLLPLFLFLTGRLAETREVTTRLRCIAPNSINAIGYPILLHAIDGNLDAALRECARVRPLLGQDGEQIFRFLARLFHQLSSEEFQWGTGGVPLPLLLEFSTLAPRVAHMLGDAPDQEGQANWSDFAMFRLPAFQDYGVGSVFQDAFRNPFAWGTLKPDAVANAVGQIQKRIPNGFFFLQHGQLLHRAGRLAEAEQSLRTALRTPSFVDVERRTLFELLQVQMDRSDKGPEPERRKLHDEARKNLFRLAQWGSYPPWAYRELCTIAGELEQHALALDLSEAWLRQAPQDKEALQARLNAEFGVGANARAAKTAGTLLVKEPANDSLRNQQGVAEYQQANYRLSLASMLEVQRLNPKNQYLEGNLQAIEQRLRLAQAEAPVLLAKLRLRQALVQARAGNHAGAVATARAAVPEKDPDGDTRLALACVNALASDAARQDMKLTADGRDKEAARLATEAVTQLQAADDAGYFKQAPRLECLRGEPDLDSLRDHPEFKRLFEKTGSR